MMIWFWLLVAAKLLVACGISTPAVSFALVGFWRVLLVVAFPLGDARGKCDQRSCQAKRGVAPPELPGVWGPA